MCLLYVTPIHTNHKVLGCYLESSTYFGSTEWIIPFVGGSFIYIAGVQLYTLFTQENCDVLSFQTTINIVGFAIGVALMKVIANYEHILEHTTFFNIY